MAITSTSPRPWRFEESQYTGSCTDWPILDANGSIVAQFVSENDAALIVDAVNAYDRVAKNLGEVDHLKDELEEAKAHAESEKRWANQYFEEAQRAREALEAVLKDAERGILRTSESTWRKVCVALKEGVAQ